MLAGFVPYWVVTRTLTGPALLSVGVVQVMVLESTTVTLVAATPPNVTPVAPVKSRPVMVTLVPAMPLAGETEVMSGGGGKFSTASTSPAQPF